MNTGMTPRAWRMLSYCCIGLVIYSMVLFGEILQNMHLDRIDQQLKAVEKQMEMLPPEPPGSTAVERTDKS